jgi:uncharacterized NAD(P)/FAD-binding protein YdhS
MRSARPDLRVTLVEKRAEAGRGMAYSTMLPEHRLNVVAGRMSAHPDEPLHFWDWLVRYGHASGDEPAGFLPRMLYGQYLGDLFEDLLRDNPDRLRRVRDECVAITPTASGVEVMLASGVSIAAHAAVLATGHDIEPAPQSAFAVKVGSGQDEPLGADDSVVILGSGLSMIDAWLTLQSRGHRGKVFVISRRGLLPQPHGPMRNPIRLDAADIPLGTELSYFARWFHQLIEEDGGRWRDVIDGIRPFNQRIWQNWPTSAKRRFLEHTKAWWDIHRHRIAPDLHAQATAAIEAGRLVLLAGKVVETRREGEGFAVVLRRRGGQSLETISCHRIYDCTGLIRDPATSSSPLLRDLIDRKIARPDPLRMGIDVTADLAVRNGDGVAGDKLFALGPLTRGTFFEIDAVPEIREQAARLAERLAG